MQSLDCKHMDLVYYSVQQLESIFFSLQKILRTEKRISDVEEVEFGRNLPHYEMNMMEVKKALGNQDIFYHGQKDLKRRWTNEKIER